MTEAQLEEHDALNQPIAQLVQRSKTRPLTQAEFLRLMSLLTTQRIISNGLAQLRFEEVWPAIRPCAPEESVIQGLSAPKLLELRQLVRQLVLEQGRKVVIFSQWRRMLTLAHWAVSDLLAENGLRAGFFTGAEGQRRRTQNIVEFHDDPDHRLLFASDAGGVGLNLQHAANCVINLELPWNPAVLEQRIGRIYRLGQKQPIDVYNLVCEAGHRVADRRPRRLQAGLLQGALRRRERRGPVRALRLVPLQGREDHRRVHADLRLRPRRAGGRPVRIRRPHLRRRGRRSLRRTRRRGRRVAGPGRGPARAHPRRCGPRTPPRPPDLDGRQDVPGRPTTSTTEEVRQLFSQLQIRREVDGRVIIEAPAEAASTLGALFEGMAALLQSMTTSPEADGPA